MSTTTKELDSMTLADLEALVATKRQTAIDVLNTEIEALEGTLTKKRSELSSLTGEPATAPKRRGRKPNRFKLNGASPKKTKRAKGKRGSVGEAITAYVTSKGKGGAKVSDIAAATGNKPANVTAFFYAKANRKKFKKVAPATFALAK